MILLIGLRNDPVLLYIFRQLNKTSLYLVFIDQQCLGHSLIISERGIRCTQNNWSIHHDEVKGVINRMTGSPKTYIYKNHNHQIQLEWLWFLLDEYYPNVLNKPSHGLSNGSKPYQLSGLMMKACKIPHSFVHANLSPPQEKDLIYKSISSIRSIVTELSTDQLKIPATEPVLFQKKCRGDNVRVHCIGNQYIAIKITSSRLDYRYSETSNHMEIIKLPKKITKDCFNICCQLNLPFSGIDLIQHKTEWVLLEINPAPGYDYFEKNIDGFPISEALGNHFLSITD